MDWKLEVVIAPVSDVERAREFYVDKLGFTLDTDHRGGETFVGARLGGFDLHRIETLEAQLRPFELGRESSRLGPDGARDEALVGR